MKIFFKNQLKMIWKKWFSFMGIFLLIFLSVLLTNSALSTNKNINDIFEDLKKSDIYHYTLRNYWWCGFNDKGFQEIQEHFFPNTNLTDQQKNLISDNQIITTNDKDINDEIQKWNYNFYAWIVNKHLKNWFDTSNYQLAVDYTITTFATINNSIYRTKLESNFNDNKWTFINKNGITENKYNFKTSNMVILNKGRMPKADNEVIISSTSKNNVNFNINNTIIIANKQYKIVGKDYNFLNYLSEYSTDLTVWLNNSNLNDIWLTTPNTSENQRHNDCFVNMDDKQYIPFMNNLNSVFNKPLGITNNLDMYKNNIKFQLVTTEITIFGMFGFIVFIITIIVITIFLKKN